MDGFENKSIDNAYIRSLLSGKYDKLMSKDEDNPDTYEGPQKGYCMTCNGEFFAELSTAYMGIDDTIEHNKTEPYNRK